MRWEPVGYRHRPARNSRRTTTIQTEETRRTNRSVKKGGVPNTRPFHSRASNLRASSSWDTSIRRILTNERMTGGPTVSWMV